MPSIDVPVIDLTDVRAGRTGALDEAAARLDDACRGIGFFAITGHGVDPALTDRVVETARTFFHLDRAEKDLVAPPTPTDFRGYLGMDTTSLAATLGDETPPDLCESFNVSGFDDEAVRQRATVEHYEAIFRENLWPERPAELRPAFEAYQAALEPLCRSLLPILARALDLPLDWFDDKIADHTSLLLANWYPPATGEVPEGQLRRGAHTDYGAFTVIAVEQIPGLQISVDGTWYDVPLIPGSFVVNLGDLMARWTNDRWVSTLHRVIVPDGEHATTDRVSVPYFFQPAFGAVIETIPTTVDADHPLRYEPVVAGEWITAKSMAMLDD
ncbi:MAG: 2-oxoglutarate and iron-dependent oxygenase domain-containing protein [Actinomycetota bacterium]